MRFSHFDKVIYSQVIFLLLAVILSIPTLAVTIVVSKEGGDYNHIKTAIDKAMFNATIKVKEGTYEESLSIDKDITLKGVGQGKVKIDPPIWKRDRPVLLIGPSRVNVKIEGINIVGDPSGEPNDFLPNGIYVKGRAKVSIINSVIQKNARNGIKLYDSSDARVIHSKILNNGMNGISLEGDSTQDATVVNSIISGNDWGIVSGIWSKRISILDSKISKNRAGGVLLRGSRATIKNSIITDNKNGGIATTHDSQVNIADTTIKNNSGSGIELSASSQLAITNSNITDNKIYGLRIGLKGCDSPNAKEDFEGKILANGNVFSENEEGKICPQEFKYLLE